MRFLVWAFGFAVWLATPVAAQNNTVVVELYTSQGCSSCPPADALLEELATREGIIALALHVDYWDYLGWADQFASAAFTARQQSYAQAAKARTVYTPQMVINGQDLLVGSRAMEVMDRIQAHRSSGLPVDVGLQRDGDRVRIALGQTEPGDYVVQLVRYTPEETVAIRGGENAGREVLYVNIVNSWQRIHEWDGAAPLVLDAAAAGPDPVVVLVQASGYGAILGAAQTR